MVRVAHEIGAFTVTGRPWVVDPDECESRSMLSVRKDGQFRSGQRTPDDPGAVLSFPWQGRESIIAVDVYNSIEQNIAAIAATLDSLRTLQRHDSAMLDAALSGFIALPASVVVANWRTVLAFPQDSHPTIGEVKIRYRTMMSRAHPDKGGQSGVAADLNRAL